MGTHPGGSSGGLGKGVGYGKVILLGEHAVVYGYPALASALEGSVALEASAGPLSIELPEWELAVVVEDEERAGESAEGGSDSDPGSDSDSGSGSDSGSDPERRKRTSGATAAGASLGGGTVEPQEAQRFLESTQHPVAQALRAIAAQVAASAGCLPEQLAVRLAGRAQIWAGAGLGSSAAMTVAIARALAGLAVVKQRPLDEAAIREAASAGERVFHGKPSGLDVALASRGGAGTFTRAGGLLPLTLPPLVLVIGHSGAPRSTAKMVAQVAERTGGDKQDPRLRGLAAAAERGIEAVRRGELAALGQAMRKAQGHLAELGLSTEKLDEMCALAEAAGAYGAKLTGAGGGGCAIALAPDAASAPRIAEAWQAIGLATRIESLGRAPRQPTGQIPGERG